MEETYRKEYDADLERYKLISENIIGIINFSLEESGVSAEITHRIKTIQSVSGKIDKTKKNYKSLRDILGIRVTFMNTYDQKQFELVFDEKNRHLILSKDIKKNNLEPHEFGYISNHYDLQMKSFDKIDMIFELQTRTIVQDAWSRFSHSISYKPKSELTADLQRKLNQLSALLELVDIQFEYILEEINKINSSGVMEYLEMCVIKFIRETKTKYDETHINRFMKAFSQSEINIDKSSFEQFLNTDRKYLIKLEDKVDPIIFQPYIYLVFFILKEGYLDYDSFLIDLFGENQLVSAFNLVGNSLEVI